MKVFMLRWPTRNGLPPFGLVALLMIALLSLILTAPLVEIELERLRQSVGNFSEFIVNFMVWPNFDYLPTLGVKLLETLQMSLLATAIAIVISLPLGFLAARNATCHPVVYRITRDALSLMRSLPELVWALVFVSAVGLGPLPGIMALAFVTVGFMGKFFAEAIETIDPKAVEGVEAHGASWMQVRLFAMFPQAFPNLAGTMMYVLDHNVRAATILGIVGAGGIGYDMVMSMRLFQYDRLILIALSIYLIVTVLDRLSDYLRNRIIHGAKQ